MAPASKGKSQVDHVKVFNLTVFEYRTKGTEKLLSELDKLLAILTKLGGRRT